MSHSKHPLFSGPTFLPIIHPFPFRKSRGNRVNKVNEQKLIGSSVNIFTLNCTTFLQHKKCLSIHLFPFLIHLHPSKPHIPSFFVQNSCCDRRMRLPVALTREPWIPHSVSSTESTWVQLNLICLISLTRS